MNFLLMIMMIKYMIYNSNKYKNNNSNKYKTNKLKHLIKMQELRDYILNLNKLILKLKSLFSNYQKKKILIGCLIQNLSYNT